MFFWLILIAAFAALALGLFLTQRGLKTKWYEWLIAGIGLFLLFFTIDNYFGALKEFENQAAGYFVWPAIWPWMKCGGASHRTWAWSGIRARWIQPRWRRKKKRW